MVRPLFIKVLETRVSIRGCLFYLCIARDDVASIYRLMSSITIGHHPFEVPESDSEREPQSHSMTSSITSPPQQLPPQVTTNTTRKLAIYSESRPSSTSTSKERAPSKNLDSSSPSSTFFGNRSTMCPSGRPHHSDPSTSAAPRSLRPAFDVLDADRDGRISRDDLKTFFSSGRGAAPLSEEDIASMISAADADRNGLVEFEEFERILCGGGGSGSRSSAALAEAFGVMDRDGDGKVGFGDLKTYLEMAGMPADDEDVRGMIRMAGGDATDGVSFDALLGIIAVDFSSAA